MSVMLVTSMLILLLLSRLGGLAFLYPAIKVVGNRLSRKEFWILNFSGARGAVSVALILLLPSDFALKPVFLSLSLIMICASLVVYPLVVKKLLAEAK